MITVQEEIGVIITCSCSFLQLVLNFSPSSKISLSEELLCVAYDKFHAKSGPTFVSNCFCRFFHLPMNLV